MPAVSFYLSEKVLAALREAAIKNRTSVSRLIREAVESHLGTDEMNSAKVEFLKLLSAADFGPWDELHRERTRESDDRD